MCIPAAKSLAGSIIRILAINASPTAFCAALGALQPPETIAWQGESDAAHTEYLAWSEKATPTPGAVNLGEIMVWLRENLPPDAILTQGAGNFSAWVHRFYRVRRFGGLIGSTSASMGYGLPAAVAMQCLHRNRTVICISGDGDFLMTGQDFATAVQYGLPIIVLVADNGMYGTIRMHQEREYPGRVIATQATQSGFRRLCLGIWRLWRRGREKRGVSRRLCGGTGFVQTIHPSSQDRSRSNYSFDNAHRDQAKVVGGPTLTMKPVGSHWSEWSRSSMVGCNDDVGLARGRRRRTANLAT